ncbi:MAG: M13 family peptidase [[Lactobacillus] timonensis]|jgi:putative endopeptidase|uniref:M13 family metallopeptidase n=1 Tax=[Lactobacillus] timonensis TaxID=1970790 RepID=UPI002352504C|nr:M13-type metalloendopeptidase [[Lactobacillus] timonensis]MCI1287068.1 M13 family peptidase [[Lactobacillus] timonensis]MCI1925456.1 M13 family peptidase [[Lactobacillus] timonensis]MCI1956792.1 M13 family peptidase [[Lactobacillus] timonensis]MCI1969782.1 M13 family peptidase [[Lactobacillus] timonensis]MCI2006005.1 M13 family peptidase [[Lactobacillus] timonensis]
MAINQKMIKDDLYEAVNGEWVKQATIPDDKPATGGFQNLDDKVEKQLTADLDDFVAGKQHDQMPTENRFAELLKLYQLAGDFERREKEGTKPLLDGLKPVQALQSYADYQEHWLEFAKNGVAAPVLFDIDADMKNATVNALFAGAPGLILPDKSYYDQGNQQGPKLMALWKKNIGEVLPKFGFSADETQQLIDQTVAFDQLLVPHVKSAEEAADYSKMYNPQTLTEFADHTKQLDLAAIIEGLIGAKPDKVIVTEPKYLAALDDILTGHFELFKSWLIVNYIRSNAGLLTDELRELNGRYGRAVSGQKKPVNQKKYAFRMARGVFSQVLGVYYGRRYFGQAAKADVQRMVHSMVDVYKQRLQNNEWLSPKTREKAIVKLNELGIQVGFPNKVPAIYDKLHVDLSQSLMANLNNLSRVFLEDQFSKWGKKVDRNRWEMSAATVNAYYHPFKNIIVFPAAVLQAPFYSTEQSSSENFGGIGAVIAHEISHAFDNNGSLFDEKGNLNNWWTDEDRAHFKKLSQKMIDEFDGLPFAGQKVNGKLTVSENIADGGGLSCALSAAKKEDDADLKAFFINWARIWRMKATTQYMQLLLSVDVHAPNKLRANVQVKNLADFYTTFNVHEGDGMYLPEDQRVNIW